MRRPLQPPWPLLRVPREVDALVAAKLLRVKLYVCPEEGCRQIGRIPGTGSQGTSHKKRKMVLVDFVEERS